MKKIAYIYLNRLEYKKANVVQALNMVSALGKLAQVTFVSGWVSKRRLRFLFQFFAVEPTFKIKRLPVILITSNFILEKITRGFYSFTLLFYLRFIKYDVIYTRDFGFLYFLSKIPKWMKPKQKIIFEMHTIYHRSSPEKVSKEQEKKTLKEVDYFIPISWGIKTDLINFFKIPEEQIMVLPDRVNLEYFTTARVDSRFLAQKYGITKDDKVVVYIGTFQEWKGIDVLVRAVKYIKTKGTKILLIGGSGQEKEKIKKLIEKEKVSNRVIVENFVSQEDVVKILKLSDVGVIPNTKTYIGSRYTSPLKLFEYMACGLPIVCSDLPAMKEILIEDVNCLFFVPEDIRDLAIKIDKVLVDSEMRESFTRNNINNIKKYSWNKRAQDVLDIISKI